MWGYKEYMHSTHVWIKFNALPHDMTGKEKCTET